LHSFIRSTDDAYESFYTAPTPKSTESSLIDAHPPQELSNLLSLNLPTAPGGAASLLSAVEQTLKFSVNTWHPGFLSKLYASPHPPGFIASVVLAALNTNVHVYSVSPVLTLVEKHVSKELASMFFGDEDPRIGGVTLPGGSASNLTAMLTARNALFPETKIEGNGSRKFVVFTSAHAHYSIEKAACMLGLGSSAVRAVKVDTHGQMILSDLELQIQESRKAGETPFFVNSTAGSTVLGSYDPFADIGNLCQREKLWFHVDGSWGGSVVFSPKLKSRLDGVKELADSVTMNPHKMLGVPVTCSFLLVRDLAKLHEANTLKAGYLFHGEGEEGHDGWQEVYDLADLTPQCGRVGDALKLYLTWVYYGRDGLATLVEKAFDVAQHLYGLVASNQKFEVVSTSPLPCLQVCFYWAGAGAKASNVREENNRTTRRVATGLVRRGWMIDYAPGEKGEFLRVVVNIQTTRETVEKLVKDIESVASI
jgi:glutamate decarboxylase